MVTLQPASYDCPQSYSHNCCWHLTMLFKDLRGIYSRKLRSSDVIKNKGEERKLAKKVIWFHAKRFFFLLAVH